MNSTIVPDFLMRYCIENNNPFISLNELPFEKAHEIKNLHCKKLNIGGFYSEYDYLIHRREIEKWIYHQFIKKGGNPKCPVPVYMFLGNSPEGEYDIRADIQKGSKGYKIYLHQLDINTLSFSYPDSMYEMDYDEHGIPVDGHRTNTPEVLVYDDLEEYIIRHNILKNKKFTIEAQVWDKTRLTEIWENGEYEKID
ncbi:MAG: hypothetical protein JXJ04_13345 [Spirochaetales bacterium]|nr:hypothetical protein [Spirochaetales bacterium]